MKSVSILSISSMPNTNTIYFHSEQQDSISLLKQAEEETFEIYMPSAKFLPYTPLEKNQNLTGNLIFTVIFLMIFAFIRLRGKDLFINLLNTLIKRKKAEIILNEGISSNLVYYILSLCLSFSILAITINYITQEQYINLFTFYLFIIFFVYHFTLLTIIRLFGWTFNVRNIADEIIVNLWTYHILSGLLVAPFVISIFFVKSFAIIPLLKIVIFGIILLMTVKIIRWVEILMTHKVLILYMILYLCALEIMPLLVLYKVVA